VEVGGRISQTPEPPSQDLPARMLSAPIAYCGNGKNSPEFEPQKIQSGRWFVSVKTGNGPDSHIGDSMQKRKTGLRPKRNIGQASLPPRDLLRDDGNNRSRSVGNYLFT
jgi:hypothetical protein